ncbi:putative arabinose-binding protein precursor [Clostridium puniceum]|uniref:Putative arabinose-binding protein n=1 Tax=Clostridium puniceum TaxID=29367 RepID=A0A1S8SXE8_9CLOT|nr:extracellular solute-binding protein [Clostridium puniceum]OOM70169.1 putative arabinose-binding protein precursor [Clostridium puniceum]
MKSVKILKKLGAIAVTTSLAATMLIGCGGSGVGNSSGKTAETSTKTSSGDEMEMWTFVELHAKFYEEMLKSWNDKNPDKQLKIKFTVLPYDDMHNKLQSALLSGQGAPDICDIEVGKFPNFLKGEPQLQTFDDVIGPYKDKIVKSRLDLYSKDNHVYGFDYHVGATIAFYNTELLEKAGIDYKTIVTWDDFKAAGQKYNEATGKYLGTADTGATWELNALLAQQGADFTDASGKPQLNSEAMVKGLSKLKELKEVKAIGTVPGGQPDKDEAYAAFNKGDYAVAIMPFWQMSRYVSYMPELAGKIALAPVPVLEKGMPRSVGGGGTGTVVTKTAKNAQLAKEFLAYAKLSEEGNIKIWQNLGFDPCNTDIWTKKDVTHDTNNKFVKYFKNNPFDVLNEIKNEIKLIKSTEASPAINNILCTVTLNSIFEDGKDVKQALDEAQAQVENELK